jgi:hypothetical protein
MGWKAQSTALEGRWGGRQSTALEGRWGGREQVKNITILKGFSYFH